MSDSSTVLCFSQDPDQLDRLVAPLEWSYPDVTVMHTDSSAAAIEHLDGGDVDTLVLDARTAAATPPIVRAAREQYPDLPVEYAEDEVDLARGCDAVVIVTDWERYRHLPLAEMKSVMRGDLLFDARNLVDPQEVVEAGLRYLGIGR